MSGAGRRDVAPERVRTAIYHPRLLQAMYTSQSTLDDVSFLVRSSNRLAVLEAVREGPRPRHELRAVADASRVTLSRILGDLEDRGWVVRTGDGYEATPEGAVVAREVRRLFANLEAVGDLSLALQWLPVDLFDFDLAALSGATVVTPTDRDLTATVTWMGRRVRGARRVRNVATGVSAEVVDAYLDAAARGDRAIESVFFGHVFDVVAADPTLQEKVATMVDSDGITVRRYDGDATPVLVTICDEVVLLCGRPEEASTPEVIETTDPEVLAWAESYFETVRADSEPVESLA